MRATVVTSWSGLLSNQTPVVCVAPCRLREQQAIAARAQASALIHEVKKQETRLKRAMDKAAQEVRAARSLGTAWVCCLRTSHACLSTWQNSTHRVGFPRCRLRRRGMANQLAAVAALVPSCHGGESIDSRLLID